MITRIPINVECYAGGRGAESPRALHLAGERLVVEAITDRWYQGGVDPEAPVAEYFKVRVAGGRLLIICYEPASHAWFLVSEG